MKFGVLCLARLCAFSFLFFFTIVSLPQSSFAQLTGVVPRTDDPPPAVKHPPCFWVSIDETVEGTGLTIGGPRYRRSGDTYDNEGHPFHGAPLPGPSLDDETLEEMLETFHDEDVTMDPALVAVVVVAPVVLSPPAAAPAGPAEGGLLLLGLLLPLLSAYNKRQSCWVWT